jgi:hypothetical protein
LAKGTNSVDQTCGAGLKEHAGKLIWRIIFANGFPNLEVLNSLRNGPAVEVPDCPHAAEVSAWASFEEVVPN